jgi:hypothetical protein
MQLMPLGELASVIVRTTLRDLHVIGADREHGVPAHQKRDMLECIDHARVKSTDLRGV